MNKIIVFLIVIALIGGGVYYAVTRSLKTSNSTSPATSNQVSGSKLKTTCDNFKIGFETEFKAGDASILPTDVAAVGSGETLCGSIASLGSVYYLTDKSDQAIVDLYKSKLTAAGCTFILSATPAPGATSFSTSYSYQCGGGKVYVGTGYKVNSLFVTYTPTR
jgi:hypothetical protein